MRDGFPSTPHPTTGEPVRLDPRANDLGPLSLPPGIGVRVGSDEWRRLGEEANAALAALNGLVRKPSQIACGFCTKTDREVRKMIAGPDSYICEECIALCAEILEEDDPPCIRRGDGRPMPLIGRRRA